MLEKINSFLNIMMGAFIGAFIGSSVSDYYTYRAVPERYAAWSAPWYTSILLYGITTVVILILCVILKYILKWFLNKAHKKIH